MSLLEPSRADRGSYSWPRPHRFLVLLTAVALLCVFHWLRVHPQAGQTPSAADTAAARVTALADECVREYLLFFPEQATLLGIPEAANGRLTDNSLAGLRAWQAKEDTWAGELAKIDSRALWGRTEWLTYGFLREFLDASRATRIVRQELWSVNHMSGWQVGFTQLAAVQPVGTEQLRAQALSRWKQVPRYIDNEIVNLKEGIRLGYTAPKRVAELVIAQLDAVLGSAPDQSPFFSPAQRDGTPEFKKALGDLLAKEIHPAVRRYRDFLRSEYLPAAREAMGISALPNGAQFYRALLRAATSLDRPAEDTYRLGEEAVAKYEREAAAIGTEAFGTADLKAIREKMAADPRNHFRSREELLNFSTDAVARARAALPRWFGILPKAEVKLEPVPGFLEPTASSSYQPGAQDGSRPGAYLINLYQPEQQTRANAEITAFHETYPGHHLQLSIATERPGGHVITRLPLSGSYIEGWARYSEALAEEMGLYSTAFARITRRLWPAHGMVVDPGIHVFGWTREKAADFILATGRLTAHEAMALVDRIIATPAQLTTYDTGALEIFALRAKAQEALGAKFDIKAFHERLLTGGAVTLPMLREIIDHWIEEMLKKGRTK